MLTDAALKFLKPKKKPYKVADRDGIYVVVSPAGSITFRLDYRINNRRETLTLGRYGRDGVSLLKARELGMEARRRVREGVSPAIEKQRDKARIKAAKTFADFGRKWIEEGRMADSTRAMRRAIYERDVEPAFKNRMLTENQIERAYGPNHSILDNCHVRVAFATNDERTARRISDTLGTATEMRAMANYAGHRLSPWLGHLMVSRQETARPLLTPGEVMQLPPHEAVILVAGTSPIRATKIRYFADPRLADRVCKLDRPAGVPPAAPALADWGQVQSEQFSPGRHHPAELDEGGLKREPEFDGGDDRLSDPADEELERELDLDGDEVQQGGELQRRFTGAARQVAMDPDDGIPLGGDA